MSEKLFKYLLRERARLEAAIVDAQANPNAALRDIQRLKSLHRAVNEQIACWMHDLYGDGPSSFRTAA